MFKYFITLFFIFSVLFFTNPLFAADNSAHLVTLLNSVKSMRANFVQTIFDNKGKAVQKSYGEMAMLRPGKFRWEVKKPIPQLVIANDSELWIYDRDLEQLTIRPLKQAAGETPALLLSHMQTVLDKEFTVKPMKSKLAGWQWFSLIPKKADSMFASIQMGFNQDQISEMRLQDHLGHTTLIQYEHIKTNLTLPSTLFTFKPPSNVDIINETHKRSSSKV